MATQVYPAALFSLLKHKQQFSDIRCLGILTDYGLQKVWVTPTTDGYCVPSQSVAEQLLAWGVPADSIYETGIPLDQQFSHPPSQGEATAALKLNSQQPTVLVTGGQYGIGLLATVDYLCKAGNQWQLLVTAGNGSDRRSLDDLQQAYPSQLIIFDWVDNMAELSARLQHLFAEPDILAAMQKRAFQAGHRTAAEQIALRVIDYLPDSRSSMVEPQMAR